MRKNNNIADEELYVYRRLCGLF